MPLPAKPPAGPVSLSQNARTVLEKRYLVKDAKGKPTESPEELFWRVATVVAEADRRYGATDGGVQNRFVGLLDEVALYNRALHPNEVMDHYQAGLGM